MGHGVAGQRPACGVVAIAADGFPAAGLGHLGRSSALAAALRHVGLEPRAYALGALEPTELDSVSWLPVSSLRDVPLDRVDVLVVDSYRDRPENDLVERLPTVVLQEHTAPPTGAALVVAVGADGPSGDPRLLYGLEYACLRPAFWDRSGRSHRERVTRVLVTTGGGDAVRGLPEALAAATAAALPEASVALVRGPRGTAQPGVGIQLLAGLESLHDELAAADVVLTAAGQTLLEAAAVGTPAIAVVAVENQRRQADQLARRGAALVVERVEHELPDVLRELDTSPTLRERLAKNAWDLVDGRGALRVADRISALIRR